MVGAAAQSPSRRAGLCDSQGLHAGAVYTWALMWLPYHTFGTCVYDVELGGAFGILHFRLVFGDKVWAVWGICHMEAD